MSKPYKQFKVKGRWVFVDHADWELVKQFKWTLLKSGYVRHCCHSDSIFLHRLVTGYTGPLHIDHINHNPRDNRRCNLRIATPSENCRNRKGPQSNNTSGYLGVAPSKWGWHAYKTIQRKRYHLGYYATAAKADWARRNWKLGDPVPRKILRSDNRSGCTGVIKWNCRGTQYWIARFWIDGKTHSAGCFRLKRDAIKARKLVEERRKLGWVIRPTSCSCGGKFAWFERVNGLEVCRGCVCHATRKQMQAFVTPFEGAVGRDWKHLDEGVI